MNQQLPDSPNLDAVHSALKAVKLLRCTVGDVFKCLADCPLVVNNDKSSPAEDNYSTPINTTTTAATTTSSNSTTTTTTTTGANVTASTAPAVATTTAPNASTTGSSSPLSEAAANQALQDLQTLLLAVNSRFRELETACTLLTTPLNAGPVNISLGNSSLLGQDPHYDKTNLYADMISAYRWSDKMVEYSSFAATLLQQNSLRRSQTPVIYVKGRPQRRPPNGHNINAQQIDNFIANLQRVLPDLTIEVVRPFGAPTLLKVTIPRVLRAVILLRGLLIEWVVVKGIDETFDDPNYDSSYAKRLRRFPDAASNAAAAALELERLDIWSESRYEVFRKVSEHANAAMLHYYSPVHCDVALKTYLV
jgi:mediator of RNA polymerase II transcription subunit 27